MDTDWTEDLDRWLEPFLSGLGHKTRRRMCPAYIAGLIGPGDRKSIQPMAARADAISYDRLHHFIGAGLWDSKPLEAALWQHADGLVGGEEAFHIGGCSSVAEERAEIGWSCSAICLGAGQTGQLSDAGFHDARKRRSASDA